ncbi:MAG: hypothetical protein AAGF88_03635 [Pseudomonadota bacterium]
MNDMDHNRNWLIGAGVVSVLMLLIFMAVEASAEGAIATDLEARWLAFAALPVLVALIAGRYIQSFSGFGLTIEGAMQEPAQPAQFDDPATFDAGVDSEKASLNALDEMSDVQLQSKRQLKMRVQPDGHYSQDTLKAYLKKLAGLEAILILRPDDTFIGTLPITALQDDAGNWHSERLDSLVRGMSGRDVAGQFAGALSTESLALGTSVADAYRRCVDLGVAAVPAVDRKGRYKGLFMKESLASTIADRTLAALRPRSTPS